MASCYYCGRPGATNRRWVTTSTGNWGSIGRRGNVRIGAGSRQSMRSLCDQCATSQSSAEDKLMTIVTVVVLLFVLFVWGSMKYDEAQKADAAAAALYDARVKDWAPRLPVDMPSTFEPNGPTVGIK